MATSAVAPSTSALRADHSSGGIADAPTVPAKGSPLNRWLAFAGTALLAAIIGFGMGTGSAQSTAGDSWSDGYDAGHQEGYDSGRSQGYSEGKSDGYDTGYDSGKSQGYTEGKSDGYDTGYAAGQADSATPFETESADTSASGGSDYTSEYSSGVVYVDELGYGKTDSDSVRRLQWVLQQEGYGVDITGDYDDDTDAAVRAWQASIGNKPDAAGTSSLGSGQATRLFADHGDFTVV